jgi:hypothetical protein
MNVSQKGLALFLGDATKFDSALAVSVKLADNQHIHPGLASIPLCLNVIFWQLLELEILHQLLCPGGAALSARASTGTGSRSLPIDNIAEPWRVAIARTSSAKMLPGFRLLPSKSPRAW